MMASKNPKKRKALSSSDSKAASPKKKSSIMSPPVKKLLPSAQDGRGCSFLTKLIDSGVVADQAPVFYMRKRDKSVMKEGVLTREGVLCTCCHQVFLLSRFEVHAGSGLHRPSANMFLKDGRSLMQCQQAIEVGETNIKTSKCSQINRSPSIQRKIVQPNLLPHKDKNDNSCQMCGDGGRLVLCDTCPSAFHSECLSLDGVPDGEWSCPRCCCGACGGSILNSGIEASLSIANPPNYLLFSPKDRLKVTASSSHDGAFPGEDDARILACPKIEGTVNSKARMEFSVLFCKHCQVPYHSNCVKGRLQHQSNGRWFCSKDCESIFKRLRSLVGHQFPLERGLTLMLICSFKEDSTAIQPSSLCQSFDRRLSEAYKIMHECFDPVIDTETGVDLLSQTLYNKKAELRRLDCRGFYALTLMKGDQMVSVATFRVHGKLLAEMPFIATKLEYRQQGLCKALIKSLESMLIDMGVYKLLLPSVDELLETWIGSFEFQAMTLKERQQVSHLGILPFVGTTVLHKSLIRPEAGHVQETAPETVESKTKPDFLKMKLKLGAAAKPAANVEPICCH